MAFPHDGKKFQAGNNANPNGRPRKLPNLDKLLGDVLGTEEDNKDGWAVIIEALKRKAAKGDVRAAELLLNRGYGKAKQFINLNHEGGVNLVFEQATPHETSQDKIYTGIQEESGCLPTEEVQSHSQSGVDPIGQDI
jgi:hypothetical protein